jgi:hypothetical protein
MKKIVFLSVIAVLLITATVVLAAKFSTMSFEDELIGKVYPIKQAGYYKWGSWNNAPEVKMTVITTPTPKTFYATSVDGNNTVQVTFSNGEYWSNGEIKFNMNIPIRDKTQVTEFEAKFIDVKKDPSSLWTYRINDRDINDDNFYAKRLSKNEYEIVCKGVALNTVTLYVPLGWVSGDALWNFKAIIVV